MVFDGNYFNTLLFGNLYESRVLKDYLHKKNLTLKDFLQVCLDKLDDGTYCASDTRETQISSETILCFGCALENFMELAYQYRKDLPIKELPDVVTKRLDCHWGKNCRTQSHNYIHAEKFNHICEQTKF
jgi:E3 ubiquitin-protein ligase CHFR